VVHIEDLQKIFRGRVALNEPLSKYTSFRIGGPAEYYLEPVDKEDVVRLILFLQEHAVPYVMIGSGSNLLISDDGIRGAVINIEKGLNKIYGEDTKVVAEAGVKMAKFVDFCIQRGFQGVEMLPGIPGTIGGAVIMNAGAYGGEISDHLVEVEVIRNGRVVRVPKADAGFAYRRSGFVRDVVLSATFQFPAGDRAALMKQRRELLIKRNQSQPLNLPNSGSVFKNPPGTFAAKLIEEAGLKGTTIGNAQISEKHGNFIVNKGNAKAADVLALIRLARKAVAEQRKVNLELEVKLLGFSEPVYKELYG
jgi:UDP-N-acetylmuramate dehydrogenase